MYEEHIEAWEQSVESFLKEISIVRNIYNILENNINKIKEMLPKMDIALR